MLAGDKIGYVDDIASAKSVVLGDSCRAG